MLPAHNLLKEKAEQENADGITKAYIAATDAMLNYIVDEKMGSKEKLKYISFDFATNFTAVAATLNNIGPGLAKVGPTQKFWVSIPIFQSWFWP